MAINTVSAKRIRARLNCVCEFVRDVGPGRSTGAQRGVRPARCRVRRRAIPVGVAVCVVTSSDLQLALAGERQQIFVGARVAADPREAVLEEPARQELIRHVPDDRTPRAVLTRKAIVVDRVADAGDPTPTETTVRPAGVGVCRRRRPPTPRLPSALRNCGAPSIRESDAQAVTIVLRGGLSDATSGRRGPNGACCSRYEGG